MAAPPSGKAAPEGPHYLHTAEVADILHVSPKTVSRWAKEGKLPFLKTLVATAATRRPRSASSPTSSRRNQQSSLVWYLQDGCARHLGDPDAVLVVDKTCDLKGRPRSGVQRQYTGR